MAAYFIGIDGGGSNCRAALCNGAGTVLGEGRSGAANILSDPDGALRHIVEAARLAFAAAGLEPDLAAARAVLGLAGTNAGNAVSQVAPRLPFSHSRIVSDGVIALQGAIGDGNGAIGILGTGSIFLARHGGRLHSIGGWGFQLSDLGSGARLGQAVLQESLLAYDRIRPMGPLAEAVLAEFGHDPDRLVIFARRAAPGDFARYAPKLFQCARDGDAAAHAIVAAGAAAIDEALDAVAAVMPGEGRLCLLGGLAGLYPDYLAERHRARLSAPKGDALAGALALALGSGRQEQGETKP